MRTLIWDLPTRLFHWMFGAGFLCAAGIAFLLGEDSPLFPYHALIGLTIAFLVCFRIIWGVVGTRWARFSSMRFSPGAVIGYLRSVMTGGPRSVGHNPATANAMILMFVLVMGLAVSGYFMGTGDEAWEEAHEVMAYGMLAVVGLHIAGVLVHTLRHRENITASMIHGKKEVEPSAAISSSRPIAAVVMVGIAAVLAVSLAKGYDSGTQTLRLPLLGTTLQLGEAEGTGEKNGAGEADDDD